MAGALAISMLLLACAFMKPFVFRFGPADKDYVKGFRVGWERGTSSRWARAHASVELPVSVFGPTRLIVVGARPGQRPTRVEIQQNGVSLGSFMVGRKITPYAFELNSHQASIFQFDADTGDPGHGMKLERIVLEPKQLWSVVPNVGVLVRVFLGTALLAAAFGFSGLGRFWSIVGSLSLLALPVSVMLITDPYAALHWTSKLFVVVPMLTGLGAVILQNTIARRAVWVFALALTVRSGLLFHPSYYFMDVDIHRRVAEVASRQGPTELWSRMDYYQQKYDLGRANVEGRFRPLPYPPMFHSLAGLVSSLSRSTSIEDVNKWLGVTSQGFVVLLLMLLANHLVPRGPTSVLVGLLATFFPEDIFELLRASYPALLGHAMDLSLITLLFLRWQLLRTVSGVSLFALGLGLCLLTYNASPVHFGVFLPLLLVTLSLKPRTSGRIGLLVGSLGGGLLSLPYYGNYFQDLASSLLVKDSAEVSTELAYRFLVGFGGWEDFGPFYLVLGGIGIGLILKQGWRSSPARLLAAWAGYAVVISIPAFLMPDPFYYFRRLYFVYPLFPLLAAYVVGRRKFLAIASTVILLMWSLHRFSSFIQPFFVTHTGSLALS